MNTSNQAVLTGKQLNEKVKSLVKVGEDRDWNIYYIGPDGEKWKMSYPNSDYHGGGAPELIRVLSFPWESQG